MKRIEVNNTIHANLKARKKAWKHKTFADTIAYLIEIAGQMEEGGRQYETDEKGRAI